MLDRKLRVINENIDESGEWLEAAQEAYRNIYAFEWQGDSLLLARESMLYTFIENYKLKFGKVPQKKSIVYIADIVSWNVWQMDGLQFVIPGSCYEVEHSDLFGNVTKEGCCGCKKNDYFNHNGIYCLIMDWGENKVIRFADLLKKGAKK